MAKALSYDDLMDYAKKHYCKGGDTVFECWDKSFYDDYVAMFGPITKSKALSIFRNYKAVEDDIRATAW